MAISTLKGIDLTGEQAGTVGLLGLVAGPDVEPGDDEGTWRIVNNVAPNRIISTVDPESRHMHKSTRTYRDGYKAHIAIEPETGVVTAIVRFQCAVQRSRFAAPAARSHRLSSEVRRISRTRWSMPMRGRE